MSFWRRRTHSKGRYQAIEPDEILIDAANLPAFDTTRLEGRIEKPIPQSTFRMFLTAFSLLLIIALGQLAHLQIFSHDALSARAEKNRLTTKLVPAERGLITDRNGTTLAENIPGKDPDTAERSYPLGKAAAHVVGYVSYPKRDQNGYWYQEDVQGTAGVEQAYNAALSGRNGLNIAETDAAGAVVSGNMVRSALPGTNVTLSLDAGIQKDLYETIAHRSEASDWQGGAGAVMDIHTGEVIALTSYPSYDPEVMSRGEPKDEVKAFLTDPRSPFLDRAVSGLYAPGSVVKPFVATAALEEHVITPEKQILSTGSISIPNPYDPTKSSVFKDWRAQGWVDMRHAIAVSSDVYFYEVGGGFQSQPGLGIAAIERYLRSFGFGSQTGITMPGEEAGVIPDPEWKANLFDGERWFLGDTYHTAIGQYGVQVTLAQLVRGVSAIANGGTLVTPVLEKGAQGAQTPTGVADSNLQVAREGMRLAVTEGIAQALAVPGVQVAAKTGTAEVGAKKEFTNSVVIGFFPYEKPRYAFAVVMERAKAGLREGAPSVMGEVMRYIVENKPDMVKEI